MTTSQALIRVGSKRECQVTDPNAGVLIRRGPGLTISQFIHKGGKLVDSVLSHSFSGPLNPKLNLQNIFSDGEARERALDELHKAHRDDPMNQHKVLNLCHELLKYASPKYALRFDQFLFLLGISHWYQADNQHTTHYLQDSCRGNHAISWYKTSFSSPKRPQEGGTGNSF